MGFETLVSTNKSLTPVAPTMADVSHVVDQIASQHILEEYQAVITEETRRRQKADLQLFAQYLTSAGIRSGDFYNDLAAWQGVSDGIVIGFMRWMVQEGYAITSCNVRLATVKRYCKLAIDAR